MCAGTFMDKQPHEAYSYFDYLANLTRDWASTGTQIPKSTTPYRAQSFQVLRRPCIAKSMLLVTMAKEQETHTLIPITRGGEIIQISDGAMRGLQIPKHIKEGFTTLNLIKNLLHHHNHRIYQPSPVTSFSTLPKPFQPPPQAQSNTYQPPHKKVVGGYPPTIHSIPRRALTLTEKGKLPAQPQPNPSRHVHSTEISNQPSCGHEQVQAITVLRSGKTIDKTILPIDPKGRGEASKVVEGTVGGDRETGEKKESEVVSREEENKNDERKEKTGSVPKSEEVLREERKQPGDLEDIREVNLIESIVQEHFERHCVEDPLARMLMFGEGLDYLEVEKVENFVNEDNGLEVCPVMTVGQWTPTLSL
ncbi:hypothetical protein Acr_22g0003370 [Actinidia rufa]|uniref:Uncharacterized protein n=1 Tax=Actinidia rufa TaxID=165716 RepID=A0A7J0GJF2_9ERIC|nr:hypothetical protein Acr_22g0003370 [Actinidia rufa]